MSGAEQSALPPSRLAAFGVERIKQRSCRTLVARSRVALSLRSCRTLSLRSRRSSSLFVVCVCLFHVNNASLFMYM